MAVYVITKFLTEEGESSNHFKIIYPKRDFIFVNKKFNFNKNLKMTLHRGQNKSRNLNFALYDPSQDSSVGSILAWYLRSLGFKSQQGFVW